MKVRIVSVICLLVCLAVAVPVIAGQAGKAAAPADPLSGTWTGDWGPSDRDRNQVSVEVTLAGNAVSGTVKTTNRPDAKISKGTFDAATGTLKMEADATNPRSGAAVKYVIEGKISGTTFNGTWSHDAVKGDFKLTKK
jgi:hypothetical protein